MEQVAKSTDICTEFHGNQADSCWDISDWTKVVEWLTSIAIPRAIPLARLKFNS